LPAFHTFDYSTSNVLMLHKRASELSNRSRGRETAGVAEAEGEEAEVTGK